MTTMTPHSGGKATVTLQGDREILIERAFDAPPELVYEAITNPEHVRRWWGAGNGNVTLCEADLRVGGKWRYVLTAESTGEAVGFHGEYRELVPGRRIVSTELYEIEFLTEEDAALNTVTLVERDGGTHMTVLVRHRLPEHRDGHIASGMESGMQKSYDALEDVARSLA